MRIAYSIGAVVLAAMVIGIAMKAASCDPPDEGGWLNEKTWPAFVASRRLEITGADDTATKLRKERFNAGQQELRDRYVYWLQGEESLPQVYDAARRVAEARIVAGGPQSDRAAILREKVAFAKVVEKQAEQLQRKFNKTRQAADVPTATYYRASVELELLRAETASTEIPAVHSNPIVPLFYGLNDCVNGSSALPNITRNAVAVTYHRFVLFRAGGDTFAIHILPNPKYGEDGITYTWYSLRRDVRGFFNPAVEVGQGETKEVHGSGVLHAGTLSMEWSKRNRDSGWLYWRDAPSDVAVFPLQWTRLENLEEKLDNSLWISRDSIKENDPNRGKGPLDLKR
jgi:hypothetical protein